MYKCVNGVLSVMTEEETDAFEAAVSAPPPEGLPAPGPTPEERIARLEETKAEQADVDELREALNLILTGVTE